MQKFYYIAGAMLFVLGGLGIYSSQAGNKMMSEPQQVMVIEEVVYKVKPTQNMDNNNVNSPKGGFMPLPEDKGVEVAPIENTQMQNPALEQAPTEELNIQEGLVETQN